MKNTMMAFALTFVMSAYATQERSLKGSTKVVDVPVGSKILITDNLRLNTNKSFDNIDSRETITGFGKWCYLGIENSDYSIAVINAGQKFTVTKVDIFKTSFERFLTITTQEGLTINCLGGFLLYKMKVKKLENLFEKNIKFIQQ